MACGGSKEDKGKMSAKQKAAISKATKGKAKSDAAKKAISQGMKSSECVKNRVKKKK